MTYTALAVVGVVAAAVLDLAVLRTRLLTRKAFWVAYAIMLFFQLLTNGWLTGRGVVRYDAAAVLGDAHPVVLGHWRVLWAPVEDVLFGFSLVVQTLAWWVFWGRRGVQPPRPRPGGDADAGRLSERGRPGASAPPPAGR